MSAGRALRARLALNTPVRLMEAHNGLSALVANSVKEPTGNEFDGVWLSSLTATASAGLPDLEMSIVDRRLDTIEQVARTSAKPVVVDGDTGGETSAFRYFCRALLRAGVAAVIVEEKAAPKRNSLDESLQLLADPYAVADKLLAGKDAVGSDDLLVIARIESLVCKKGIADALLRANIYAEAGLDAILIHSKAPDPDEVIEFSRQFRLHNSYLPIFCVPTTYSSTHVSQLFNAGIQGIIYANHQLRAAHFAMENACRSILRAGCSAPIENMISATGKIFDEVGYTAEVRAVAARLGNSPAGGIEAHSRWAAQ